MSKGINKAFLLGHVGKDPEVRSTNGGSIVASFSLATADRHKDGQGNLHDKTEWHSLVAFNRTAEIVRDYVKKGSKLYIEGKITTNSWDDKETGVKKYRTEILVNELVLLTGREEGSGGGAGAGGYSRPASSSSSAASFDQRPPAAAAGQDEYSHSAEISDDDIPF